VSILNTRTHEGAPTEYYQLIFYYINICILCAIYSSRFTEPNVHIVPGRRKRRMIYPNIPSRISHCGDNGYSIIIVLTWRNHTLRRYIIIVRRNMATSAQPLRIRWVYIILYNYNVIVALVLLNDPNQMRFDTSVLIVINGNIMNNKCCKNYQIYTSVVPEFAVYIVTS